MSDIKLNGITIPLGPDLPEGAPVMATCWMSIEGNHEGLDGMIMDIEGRRALVVRSEITGNQTRLYLRPAP